MCVVCICVSQLNPRSTRVISTNFWSVCVWTIIFKCACNISYHAQLLWQVDPLCRFHTEKTLANSLGTNNLIHSIFVQREAALLNNIGRGYDEPWTNGVNINDQCQKKEL